MTEPIVKSGTIEKQNKICKRDDAKRLVYGIVYEPDVTDGQGDRASKDEIEKSCHNFMKNHQKLSIEHGEIFEGVQIVECWLQKGDGMLGDQKVTDGTWLLGVYIKDDKVWEDVVKGEITGFSMEGLAERIYKPGESVPN